MNPSGRPSPAVPELPFPETVDDVLTCNNGVRLPDAEPAPRDRIE